MHLIIFGCGILPSEHSTLHKLFEHRASDPFGKVKCSRTGPQSVSGPNARPPDSFNTSGSPSEITTFIKDGNDGRVCGVFAGLFGADCNFEFSGAQKTFVRGGTSHLLSKLDIYKKINFQISPLQLTLSGSPSLNPLEHLNVHFRSFWLQ